jgi:WD40 repeat protein
MILIGLHNGFLNEINEHSIKEQKKFNNNVKISVGESSIVKILNIKEKYIIIGSKKNGIKILTTKNYKEKFFLKNPTPDLKDFVFSGPFCFGVFGNFIFLWKKFSSAIWKLFGKIKLNDFVDKIAIGKKSKLMLSVSFSNNQLNLWKLYNKKLLYCGSTIIKEKIGAFGIDYSNDNFALGTLNGKIYIYSSIGKLSGTIYQSKYLKKHLISSKTYPISFFDDNVFFSGGFNNQLCKWDIRVKKVVSYWHGHIGEINKIDCSISNNNQKPSLILSSDNFGIVKIWDNRKEKEMFSFKFLPNLVSALKIF